MNAHLIVDQIRRRVAARDGSLREAEEGGTAPARRRRASQAHCGRTAQDPWPPTSPMTRFPTQTLAL